VIEDQITCCRFKYRINRMFR